MNNNPLSVGDEVAYAISLSTDLKKGTITKFTSKMVHIKANGYTAQRYPYKIMLIR